MKATIKLTATKVIVDGKDVSKISKEALGAGIKLALGMKP